MKIDRRDAPADRAWRQVGGASVFGSGLAPRAGAGLCLLAALGTAGAALGVDPTALGPAVLAAALFPRLGHMGSEST